MYIERTQTVNTATRHLEAATSERGHPEVNSSKDK